MVSQLQVLRFQLLLHLLELLCSHRALPFTKFLQLFPGTVKVWPGRWWWDLQGPS